MSEPIPPELAGAWRLIDLEERAEEQGSWEHPLGEDARGVFFCGDSVRGELLYELTDQLRGRDSNPDNGLQRAASCH